jgi:hypothetical protein
MYAPPGQIRIQWQGEIQGLQFYFHPIRAFSVEAQNTTARKGLKIPCGPIEAYPNS